MKSHQIHISLHSSSFMFLGFKQKDFTKIFTRFLPTVQINTSTRFSFAIVLSCEHANQVLSSIISEYDSDSVSVTSIIRVNNTLIPLAFSLSLVQNFFLFFSFFLKRFIHYISTTGIIPVYKEIYLNLQTQTKPKYGFFNSTFFYDFKLCYLVDTHI